MARAARVVASQQLQRRAAVLTARLLRHVTKNPPAPRRHLIHMPCTASIFTSGGRLTTAKQEVHKLRRREKKRRKISNQKDFIHFRSVTLLDVQEKKKEQSKARKPRRRVRSQPSVSDEGHRWTVFILGKRGHQLQHRLVCRDVGLGGRPHHVGDTAETRGFTSR